MSKHNDERPTGEHEVIYGRAALARFREYQAKKKAKRETRIRFCVKPDEQLILEEKARCAKLTMTNYVRSALGMPPIDAGHPSVKQDATRAEWVRIQRAKLHPEIK